MHSIKRELISIIIPCYNTGDYIVDTLNSVSKQSYNNYEIILVDDGSIDNTKKAIKKFIKNNPKLNITYFYKENGGVSSARNFGLKHCNGEYVVFIDSDDLVESNMIEELYNNMCTNNSDYVISNGIVVKNGHRHVFPFCINKKNIDKIHLIVSIFSSRLAKNKFDFNYNFCRSACCKLFKKSIIDKFDIKFDNNFYLFEDGFFNLNYLKYANRISYTDKALYIYNIEQGKSSKFRPNIIAENEYKINLLKEYISIYQNKYIDIAFDIYNIDLFFDFVKKYLNDIQSNLNHSKKLEILKREFNLKYKKSFNKSVFSSLNIKKKILFILIKLKLFRLILLVVKRGV